MTIAAHISEKITISLHELVETFINILPCRDALVGGILQAKDLPSTLKRHFLEGRYSVLGDTQDLSTI